MNQLRFFKIVALIVVAGLVAGCNTDPDVRKRKYLASGDRYSSEGKYREAAIQYQNSLKADKDFPDAHYALAKAYVHLGSIPAAFHEISLTVQLQPTNYQARIDLGNLYLTAGKTDQAEEQAKAVLAAQPDNPDVHAMLSAIALKRGNLQAALKEINRAIELGPDRSEFYDDLALLELHDPSLGGAVEDNLKRAVALNPKSVDAKLLQSAYYLDHNKMAEAERASRDAISADPKSLGARSSLAQIYIKEGNQAEAEKVLRQASQDLSDDPKGVRLLADYYLSSGQNSKAESEFASIAAKHPKDLNLQKAYLRTLLQVQDYSSARKVANSLLKDHLKDPEIVALNGIVLLSSGNADDAVDALQEGAKNFSQDAFLQYWLGMAALAKGDSALAQKSFQQAVSLNPTALDALEQLARIAVQQGDMSQLSDVATKEINAAPNFAGGYVWRAIMEMHQNAIDKAEADLQTSMRVAPHNPQPYVELAKIRFAQKHFPEAVTLLEQALQYDPNRVEAMQMLVSYDLYSNQPQKALSRLNDQIQKSPKNSGFLDLLAEVELQQKQTDQASATIQRAIQLNSKDVQAVTLYTKIAVQQGKTQNAVNLWQRWSDSHPKDANAVAILGTLEEATGNKQQAETDYRHALQIQPQQPIAANNLAYLMLENSEDLNVALTLAQTARQAMPNSPSTADTLAWAYYRKGTYEFARQLLEEAIKADPNSATKQYHLGMVYAKLKDKSNAEVHLKKAMALGHGTPTENEAGVALQNLG